MSSPTEKHGRRRAIKGQLEILRVVVPKIPFLIGVLIAHILRISESSKFLDLQSNLTISFLRNLLNTAKPEPLSKTQNMMLKDPGVKGRIWISKVASVVPPEEDIRTTLIGAIESTRQGWVPSDGKCRIPDIASVEAEWTGYRASATPDSTLPQISEEEKYQEMMKECKNPTTVLYFHGGAYYLCDPVTHRPSNKKLAKLTGGRTYSVRYRLAPQHPFPSALLDALVSYFTLLYPPPGAFHQPVAPSHIVFGGDSAGGNLSLALLQTLLEIRRQNQKIRWFGEDREVPLPAGVTANSPWLDVVQSFPSWQKNQQWDYLPLPNLLSDRQTPPDHIWPANPPRKHVFIDDDFLLHPLASLHLSSSWAGSPPIYICSGWECLGDEDRWIAQKLEKDGVKIVYEEYEAMPHVFAMILPSKPEAKRCFQGWTNFISQAVENPEGIETRFTEIKAKTCKEIDIDVEKLSSFSDEELRKMAFNAIGRKASLPDTPAKL